MDLTNFTLNESARHIPSDGIFLTFQIILLIILIIITGPGNLILSLLLLRQRRSVATNGFIIFAVSMSFTDIGVGFLILPVTLLQYVQEEWPLGETECISFKIAEYGLSSVTIFMITSIGFDRYKCVTSPLSYRTGFKQRRFIVASVIMWIIGIVAWVPGILITSFKRDGDWTLCVVEHYGYFALAQCLFMYHLPILITVTLYGKLVVSIRRRLQHGIKTSITRTYAAIPIDSDDIIVTSPVTSTGCSSKWNASHKMPTSSMVDTKQQHCLRNNDYVTRKKLPKSIRRPNDYLRSQITSQNRKCIKTSIIVIGTCVVAWAPFCLIWPVFQICEEFFNSTVYHAFSVMTYVNSALNPFIYFTTSKQLRCELKKLILRHN